MAQLPSNDVRFRALFDAYAPSIERYCLRRLRPAAAADATAETMLVAWRRIDQIPPGDDSKLWLYGVARNVVATARRSENRRLRLDSKIMSMGVAHAEGPETQVVRRTEDQELLEAMERMKPKDREILELRIWDELSRSEVATVLRISEAGVDKRYSRALQRLRRSLETRTKRRSPRHEREEVDHVE